MKIEVDPKQNVAIYSSKSGDVFRYDGAYFIVTDEQRPDIDKRACVNLETGVLHWFNMSLKVVRVAATVRVEGDQ